MTMVSRRSRALAATADVVLRPIFAHTDPAGPGRMVLRGTVAAGGALGGLRTAAGTRVVRDTVPGELIVPDDAQSDSIILYLHGGGYVAGSARLERATTSDLAAATRIPVLALDYRRAPKHRFPAARTDALAAYRSLIARGYPPGRIALVGVSAGAHLAMSMLTTLIEHEQPLPAAAVLFSPLLDTSGAEALVADTRKRDPFLPPVFAQRCAGVFLDGEDATSPHVDVLQAPATMLANMPPISSFVGSTECFAADAARLHRALLDAGVHSETTTVPGQVHSFVSMCRRLPESRTALLDAAAFLRRHLYPDFPEEDNTMIRGHSLTATDDAFFDDAPVRASHTTTIAASPEQVWRALCADDAVVSWSPTVTAARWDDNTPRSVGAVRTVTLGGAVKITERFYRWDENKRMTFSATDINRPLCRAFAEDYILEDIGSGTRFTWRAAMDPTVPAPLHKALSSGFGLVLAHLTKGMIRTLK